MELATLVGLVLLLISLIYFWIRKKFLFFEDRGILHEKPSFPLGNLKGSGKDFHIAIKVRENYEKFKAKAPLYGMYFFINPNFIITDLELVKHVLVKDFSTFQNRGLYHNEVDDPLTGHLLLLENDAWKNMRAKMTPTFTSGKVKMMFHTVLQIADAMVSQLKTEPNLEMIEMKNVLGNFTTDVIGNVAFGLEMNSIKDPDAAFRKMFKKLLSPDAGFQVRNVLLSSFQTIAKKLHMRLIPTEISDFFMNIIRETVNYRLENKIERNDIMDLLLKIKDNGTKEEGKISFNELAAQCFIWFVAGFETSSYTASFVLYLLTTHPKVQDKLRQEIKDVLTKHNDEFTYEAMQEMKYLHMVVDETLRLYGPGPHVLREASKDYKVLNTNITIPKGSLVMVPIFAIHHDPDIYPLPDKFDPERFSDENKKNRHSMAFIPFGEGPRTCIALRFGLMQTKLSLIKLLMNFKFSTTVRTPIPMKLNAKSTLLTPEGDMWLKVENI